MTRLLLLACAVLLVLAACETSLSGEAYKAGSRDAWLGRCTDTDGGPDLFERGRAKTRGGDSVHDICSAKPGFLAEAICERGRAVSREIRCPTACEGGVCLPPCTDSDDGKHLFSAGTTYLADGTSYADTCYDNASVTEFYCKDHRRLGMLVAGCPVGCEGGRCLRANATIRGNTTRLCKDSDGGVRPEQRGTVEASGLAAKDRCLDGTRLAEQSCTPDGQPQETILSCPERCADGACPANVTCPPCIANGQCAPACGKLGCRPDPDCANQTICHDSDGGRKYYEAGTVNVSLNGTLLGEGADTCKNSTVLIEQYCAHGRNQSDSYRCGGGCAEGACRRPNLTNSTCTDTDGGLAPAVRGRVETRGPGAAHHDATDRCLNATVLKEYFCGNVSVPAMPPHNLTLPTLFKIESAKLNCSGPCVNGSCAA